MHRALLATAAALVSVLSLAACSASEGSGTSSTPSTSASPSASETNPYGAAVVDPLGPDEPVITLSGGSGGKVGLTLAELEDLGTVSATVYEPFVKKQQSFTGVPLSAVLDRGGIASSSTIDTIALNDYEYSNLASTFEASEAILATQRDGQPIPYDQGGPVRLVFPDGTELAGVLDAWNWSLSEIAASGS